MTASSLSSWISVVSSVSARSWSLDGFGCDRPVAQGADARDAEADYSKQESSGKNDLERLPIAVSLRALGRPQAECQNLKTHRAAPRLPHRILELCRLKIGLMRIGKGPVELEISTEPEVAPAWPPWETTLAAASQDFGSIGSQLERELRVGRVHWGGVQWPKIRVYSSSRKTPSSVASLKCAIAASSRSTATSRAMSRPATCSFTRPDGCSAR